MRAEESGSAWRCGTKARRPGDILRDMSETERVEALFVVRLWREAGGERSEGWRGYVEHIASKQRLYFSDFTDLTDFMRLRCEK